MDCGEENMSAFNLIISDLKQGVFKNIRFTFVPLLCLFECLVTDIQLNYTKSIMQSKLSIMDFILEIFRGSDPLSKVTSIQFPYYWFAIFACLLLTSFDYAHKDLTHFGIQVITRIRKRSTWWYSKVITSISASIFYYILFLFTVLLYCAVNGYRIDFEITEDFINLTGATSGVYTYNGIAAVSLKDTIMLILSPMMIMITLNILLCTLSILFKPIIALLVTIGYLLAGAFWDFEMIVSRGSMIMMNQIFFSDGYNHQECFACCLFIVIFSIVLGRIIIEKYDIMPERE